MFFFLPFLLDSSLLFFLVVFFLLIFSFGFPFPLCVFFRLGFGFFVFVGGIYVNSNGLVSIHDSFIANNSAEEHGGGG